MITRSDISKHGIVSIFKRMLCVNQWAHRAVTYLQFNRHTACCLIHRRRCYIYCVFFDTVKHNKCIWLKSPAVAVQNIFRSNSPQFANKPCAYIRKFFFSQRSVHDCNSLLTNVEEASSVSMFKNRLDDQLHKFKCWSSTTVKMWRQRRCSTWQIINS